MPLQLIHQTSEGKRVEWNPTDSLLIIDGVRVTPEFLVQLVNQPGTHALRFKRVGDECHVQQFDLQAAKPQPPAEPG